MNTVLYYTKGLVPTSIERAEISKLKESNAVFVRNKKLGVCHKEGQYSKVFGLDETEKKLVVQEKTGSNKKPGQSQPKWKKNP